MTMVNAAVEESANLSSEANSKALTANVLKSKGLKIKVAGNSFMTSTNTIISAVSVELFMSGI